MAIYKSIIGVDKRREFIEKVQLPRLDTDYVVTYDNPTKPRWCWGNHVYAMQQALASGNQYSHYLVLEDDGLPVNDFDRHVEVIAGSELGDGLNLLYRSSWSGPYGTQFEKKAQTEWQQDGVYRVYRDMPMFTAATHVTVGFLIPWAWLEDIVAWDSDPQVRMLQQWIGRVFCRYFDMVHWRHFADMFLALYCLHRMRDRWVPYASLVEHVGGHKSILKGVQRSVYARQYYGDIEPVMPPQRYGVLKFNYNWFLKNQLKYYVRWGVGEPFFVLLTPEVQAQWKDKVSDQWTVDGWKIMASQITDENLLHNIPVIGRDL